MEFNCAKIIRKFNGVLIDGNRRDTEIAKKLMPKNIEIINKYLTLENIDFIDKIQRKFGKIGILSIDVDGNDYHFLERILTIGVKPDLIIIEYNASFGRQAITTPYKEMFDRHKIHESGWYHGASLKALTILSEKYGYALLQVTQSGLNAFYIDSTLINQNKYKKINVDLIYREHENRNYISNTTAHEQWEKISHLEYIKI